MMAAFAATASGQTVYWLELDVDAITDQSSDIDMFAGETRVMAAYISDSGTELMRSYSLEYPADSTPSGVTMPFVSAVVDSGRADWIFAGVSGSTGLQDNTAGPNGSMNYLGIVNNGADAVVETAPGYMFHNTVNSNAVAPGVYTFDVINVGLLSFLLTPAQPPTLIVATYIPLTVNVLAAPPANDDCVDAIEIFNGVTPFDNNATASDVAGPSCRAAATNDIWYTYVATCDGVLEASTCDDATFDTVLALYDGTSCAPLGTEVGCNDDGAGCAGFSSILNAPVVAGNTYTLQLSGWDGTEFGTGNLTLSCFDCTIDADCDDGNVCNGAETCVANTCTAGTPLVIDDGVGCTDDSCDPITGVANVPNDGSCSNNDVCDGIETCDAVLDCQPGTPIVVDDGVGCTDDVCDPIAGLVSTPNDANCDNGLFCDGAEICDAVTDCGPGVAPDCSLAGNCEAFACDELNDQCVGGQLDNLACATDADCQLYNPAGVCNGSSLCEFACVADAECDSAAGLAPNGECVGNLCTCSEVADVDMCLTAVVDNVVVPNDDCYDLGSEVVVQVLMDGPLAAADAVAGAQFFVQYDSSVLALNSIEPGGSDPAGDGNATFVFELFEDTNPADCAGGGCIDYAVGNDPFGLKISSTGPAVVAVIRFTAIAKCETDGDAVCYREHNPMTGYGTGAGDLVIPISLQNGGTGCCTGTININGDAPVFTCPFPNGSINEVNADCGVTTRTMSYGPINATDECGGLGFDPLTDCSITFFPGCVDDGDCGAGGTCGIDGICVNDLVANYDSYLDCTDGCVFEAGRYVYDCNATSKCGLSSDCDFEIINSGLNTLVVDIEVSPTMDPGDAFNPLTRCFDIRLLACDAQPPLEFNAQVDVILGLGGAVGTAGHGTFTLKVPVANWDCIEAGDPLHTLRSTSSVECLNNEAWYAAFKGSPTINPQAHWLTGGNLNGDVRIDIADFTAYISAATNVGTYDSNGDTIPDGSSGCVGGIHADINGDGIVNLFDFSFIAINFFQNDKARCEDTICAGGAAATAPSERPRDRMSVRALVQSGLEDAALADFNGDGFVDLTDMQLYLDGEGVEESAPERELLNSTPAAGSNARAGIRR